MLCSQRQDGSKAWTAIDISDFLVQLAVLKNVELLRSRTINKRAVLPGMLKDGVNAIFALGTDFGTQPHSKM